MKRNETHEVETAMSPFEELHAACERLREAIIDSFPDLRTLLNKAAALCAKSVR